MGINDENADTAPILVRLDIDSVTGTPFLADLASPDVSSTVGSPNHGFSFTLPTSLPNGTHTVTLFVQDAPGIIAYATNWINKPSPSPSNPTSSLLSATSPNISTLTRRATPSLSPVTIANDGKRRSAIGLR